MKIKAPFGVSVHKSERGTGFLRCLLVLAREAGKPVYYHDTVLAYANTRRRATSKLA